MSTDSAYQQLRARVLDLFRLNPDLRASDRQELHDLASRVPREHFAEFASLADRLIQQYLASAPKRAERDLLGEYFEHLDRSARLLAAQGDIAPAPGGTDSSRPSVALVQPFVFDSLDWCRVLTHAAVPKPLVLAVEACQQRHQLIYSVLEPMLLVLQTLDLDQALRWEMDYLDQHRGALDQDLVRDLLNAWQTASSLPRAALEWAELWSADENLQRQWPTVVRGADRLLRNHALHGWNRQTDSRSGSVSYLRHLIRQNRLRDELALRRWLESGIKDIGESVQFFVSLKQGEAETSGATDWQPAAFLREVRTVHTLLTPVLLLADLILDVPDGAYRFALAFFGLLGSGRSRWQAALMVSAEEAVRRRFLRDLRQGVPPLETIRRLAFGDSELVRNLSGQLDWLTKRFDSYRQRERVVRQLAVYYASYREGPLLASEVGRRYRNLMRVVHEDNLGRVLTPEQFAEIGQFNVLPDLAAVAGDARRFLTRRRTLDTSLEEMVAAELDFVRSVRQRRLRLVHGLLAG